jgi:hypothetical protein
VKALLKWWVVRVLALLFAGSAAFAQDRVPFRQEELDQMLAPIALYPDSLLSQMLMAATYPLEVVQAARWSRSNPSLKGEDAVKAVEGLDWDPSVKSLVAFPEVLARMDENLEWTERLGEAFLAQQEDVMDSIQHLRRRADEAGNLQSSERMRVVREPENIVIEPPAQEVVYVPYYSPAVVYGPWWYPAYPPVYWGPPPAYYAWGPAFYWGPPIAFGVGFFFGSFDWHHRHAVVHHHHHYVQRRHGVNRADAVAARRSQWRHDPAHRRGVPFRTAAARSRFEEARRADREQRAERGNEPRVERRGEDARTADLRQRRVDERRNGSLERRDDRGAAGGGRQSLTDDRGGAGRQPESRRPGENRAADKDGRSVSDNRREQPDTRSGRPEPRGGQTDRDGRSGGRDRSSGGDRRGDRSESGDSVTRFRARSSEPPFGRPQSARAAAGTERRPTARMESRPRARIEARPSARIEGRPAVRPEPPRRAYAPSAPAFAGRRAQPHADVRAAPAPRRFMPESAPMPRASVGVHAPRMRAEPRGGGGGGGGGGRQEARRSAGGRS